METMSVETDYDTVVNGGEVLRKSGRHGSRSGCDCDFDAELGGYRNVEVLYEGNHYVFYHSTAVVIDLAEDGYRLANGGWKTSTTKERINEHLPSGYKLVQRDCDWYVETNESRTQFRSGMTIVPEAQTSP